MLRNTVADYCQEQIFGAESVLTVLKKVARKVVDVAEEESDYRPFLHLVELYGQFLINNSEEARMLAEHLCSRARHGDKNARQLWRDFCKALSRLIPGPPQKPMPEQFEEIYHEEYQCCKEAKKILNRRFLNPTTPYRLLKNRFGFSRQEVDQGWCLKPREWAPM
jgi:hypothetical protein